MQDLFLISLIEALYIVYMFRYFKTTVSMNLIPLRFLDYSSYMIHQKKSSNVPVSHICQFGHDMAFVIGGFFILRNYVPWIMKNNSKIIVLILFGCLLNINALVYFLPILLIEFYYFGYEL